MKRVSGRHVFVDLDGTLTNPRDGIVRCIRHALDALGAQCPPDSDLESFIGPPLMDSFGVLLGRSEPDAVRKAVALYRERFATVGMFENAVYPGIPEALSAMRAAGLRLVVATSKPTVYARRIVEHFGLARFFDGAIYGSELDGTFSDKPRLIAHILGRERLEPSAVVMVGDRAHDVLGAKANDMASIGVLWGFGSRDELASAGATALCASPSRLAECCLDLSPFFAEKGSDPIGH